MERLLDHRRVGVWALVAAVLAVGITGTLLLWQAGVAQQRVHIERTIESEAQNVATGVQQLIDARALALVRMAERWQIRGGMTRGEWNAAALLLLAHQPGYQAIEWVSPDFHVRWVMPLRGNEAAQGLDLGFEQQRRRALQAARDRRRVTTTSGIDLVQGGKGLLIYVPMFPAGKFEGFILGVFRVQQLIDVFLQKNTALGYAVVILEDDEELYAQTDPGRRFEKEWSATSSIEFYDTRWRARIWPRPELLRTMRAPFPHMTLVVGLAITFLLAFAVSLAYAAHRRTRDFQEANQRLQAEIAKREQAQTARSRSDHLLRSIIDNTTAVIYVKWADGRYIMINSRYEQLFNVTQEQMQGRTDHDIFPKDIADAFRENDLKVLETRKPMGSEEYAPHADGLHAYISVKFPLLDASGVPFATGGISSDITELKRAQEDLRKSEEDRFALLQQSDALKSALLSSVSHEFKTPLTTIKNAMNHIREAARGPGRHIPEDLLLAADKDLDYLGELVDNLLTMSRIEAGDVGRNRQWYPLEELLEGALRRVKPLLQNRKLDLDISPELPPVRVDGLQIQEVLVNLLDNAVKYSLDDSVIRVRVRASTKEMETHVVSIGEVIPPEDLPRLFERFYRTSVKRDRVIRGTGLGLAICKGLVEGHGGRIWAESNPARKETLIAFTLPLEPYPGPSTDRPGPPVQS